MKCEASCTWFVLNNTYWNCFRGSLISQKLLNQTLTPNQLAMTPCLSPNLFAHQFLVGKREYKHLPYLSYQVVIKITCMSVSEFFVFCVLIQNAMQTYLGISGHRVAVGRMGLGYGPRPPDGAGLQQIIPWLCWETAREPKVSWRWPVQPLIYR